jgi:hypothetical protein
LEDEYGGFVVVNEDGIDLLIVGTIGDVVSGLNWITQMNVSQVPCDEALPVVREVLLVVFLADILRNSVVHRLIPSMRTID